LRSCVSSLCSRYGSPSGIFILTILPLFFAYMSEDRSIAQKDPYGLTPTTLGLRLGWCYCCSCPEDSHANFPYGTGFEGLIGRLKNSLGRLPCAFLSSFVFASFPMLSFGKEPIKVKVFYPLLFLHLFPCFPLAKNQ